jgi:hypothetical protein
MNPRVRSVVPRDDHKLELTFNNGEVGIFDCAHLLNFGVFREFQDIGYFKRARVEHGTVVWPHDQDICPDTLYEDSTKVPSLNAESQPPEPRTRSSTVAASLPAAR